MANRGASQFREQGKDAWKIWEQQKNKKEIDLKSAKLIGADLKNAKLSGAKLSGAYLMESVG